MALHLEWLFGIAAADPHLQLIEALGLSLGQGFSFFGWLVADHPYECSVGVHSTLHS